MIRSAAAGVGNVRRPVRRLDRPRRHRRRLGARLAPSSARATRTSARRSRSATRSRRRSCSSARSSCSTAGCSSSLQDLGAAGLTSSASEMASKGGVGIDLDVARVPLREADMEPFEIMVSESQERMLCVCEPARLDEVLAVCARWEVHGTAIGEVTDTGRDAHPAWRRARRRHAGRRARRRLPALRPRARARRPRRCTPPPAPLLAPEARPAEALLALLALAQHRVAPAALPAVRLARAVAHRAPPRAGRRRRAAAAGRRRARRLDRRQRAPRRRRPVPRHDRGRARVRGQPRVRRRRAARRDEQPELRQPREAAHRLAAHRGRARAGRRLPRAGDAGRRRQRLALQRGRRRARSTRRRSSGWSGACPTRAAPAGSGSRARATSSRSPARSGPRCAAGELAKLCGEPLPGGLPDVDLERAGAAHRGDPRRGPRGACSRARTTSPRAACSWRVAEACLAGGVGADARRRRLRRRDRAPVRRGPGGLRRLRRRRRRLGAWPSGCPSRSSAGSAATT